MRLTALAVLCAIRAAHADGYFYEQSFGVSTARQVPMLNSSLRLRVGVGMRLGAWSVEPWLSGDLTYDRVGATYDLFGGDPAPGHADLTGMGVDVRYTTPLPHNLAIYIRGGPRVADGLGALNGYSGRGLGAGTGIQLSGQVRALGFLWAPLFFVKRGPKVIGAVFLDAGVDAYHLSAAGSPTLDTPIVSTNLGFAIGSDF